jgi:hypothetical protein
VGLTERLGSGADRIAGEPLKPRLVVVSYAAGAPFSPRAVRTRALIDKLGEDCTVDLVAGRRDQGSSPSTPYARRSLLRRAANFIHSSLLLDKFELSSRRRFHAWKPVGSGALLIGYPFSPLAYASRRLAEADIPYVVDIGDPWVLTLQGGRPATRNLARLRARSAERRMWAGAAGAVVTTERQSSALRELFPDLAVLVRPNGFEPADNVTPAADDRKDGSKSVLSLVHFGEILSPRIDIGPLLQRLVDSERWQRIEFHQYGSDWTGTLSRQRGVNVTFHQPRPWSEIIRDARTFDLAVVIGNQDPSTLPSKVVAYLQLPIPRLAIVGHEDEDSVARYVKDKPGWLIVRPDQADAPGSIADHLSPGWTDAELAAPIAESWEYVTAQIADFVLRALRLPSAKAS